MPPPKTQCEKSWLLSTKIMIRRDGMLSPALKRECEDTLLEDALLCTEDARMPSYALKRGGKFNNLIRSHMYGCNRDNTQLPFELYCSSSINLH